MFTTSYVQTLPPRESTPVPRLERLPASGRLRPLSPDDKEAVAHPVHVVHRFLLPGKVLQSRRKFDHLFQDGDQFEMIAESCESS